VFLTGNVCFHHLGQTVAQNKGGYIVDQLNFQHLRSLNFSQFQPPGVGFSKIHLLKIGIQQLFRKYLGRIYTVVIGVGDLGELGRLPQPDAWGRAVPGDRQHLFFTHGRGDLCCNLGQAVPVMA